MSGDIDVENKGKRNADKIKFPYNQQHTDKYLRQAECKVSLGTPNCLNVNALLEEKQP